MVMNDDAERPDFSDNVFILEADDYKTHHCHTPLHVVELFWAMISCSSLTFLLCVLHCICALGQSHVGYVHENA